ncbi:hypothetical protein [Mucilaginibacter psychrotolerans]|uniref:Uncharacterized protein n=1 Tax=Mucilaginibacter psychrotolerans TaxID=1524096 RepID=A0A4Y8SIC7_9SPHI|nr:hypothetical protein [Mucilaginibacter psychrotolerans]TFF38194.1 hypothetical protein E2R66_09155 [Mucilaginibacter psychrotolerans]
MRIKLSFSYIISFLLLVLLMLELHELVHITTGRIICGAFGTRDFNVWQLCADCEKAHPLSWVATLAGPVFSFMLMWLGMYWLYAANAKMRALGFAFIFANIPFGRISQAMMGGGDEMLVTRHLLKDILSHGQMVCLCSAVLLALGLPPIMKAYRSITNKYTWLYLLGFLTLPLVFILSYVLTLLNSLLNDGLLATPWVMGTPLLITLHTLLAAVLFTLFYKRLMLIGVGA